MSSNLCANEFGYTNFDLPRTTHSHVQIHAHMWRFVLFLHGNKFFLYTCIFQIRMCVVLVLFSIFALFFVCEKKRENNNLRARAATMMKILWRLHGAYGYTYERTYVNARIRHTSCMSNAQCVCQISHTLALSLTQAQSIVESCLVEQYKFSIHLHPLIHPRPCINNLDWNPKHAEHITSRHFFQKINVRRRFQWQPRVAPGGTRFASKLIQEPEKKYWKNRASRTPFSQTPCPDLSQRSYPMPVKSENFAKFRQLTNSRFLTRMFCIWHSIFNLLKIKDREPREQDGAVERRKKKRTVKTTTSITTATEIWKRKRQMDYIFIYGRKKDGVEKNDAKRLVADGNAACHGILAALCTHMKFFSPKHWLMPVYIRKVLLMLGSGCARIYT